MTDKISKLEGIAPQTLVQEIRSLIEASRSQLAVTVNASLTMLYWNIGNRINLEVIKKRRAEYGEEIVATLSLQLTTEYGRGFSEKSLRHMCRFADIYSDFEIVSALMRQLSWTHFIAIIYIENPLKRDFYAEMCRVERWSTRTLKQKIDSMLFERTALSRKPNELIEQELQLLKNEDRLSPDLVFRDPYFLDFLGLADRYFEKDLEDAILRELEQFLLELGSGFAFLARQKRIQLDNDDFYIDLLFYHRGLNRLIAIDLKLGDFKPAYKGQMELYLHWLNKNERRPNEDEPLGIILCAGKKQEQIEYMDLEQSGIHVAEYLTALPSKELLRQKLHQAIANSRLRLENRSN